MVLQLAKEPSARLLKHVVRCYLRLSDNVRYYEEQKQISFRQTNKIFKNF